MLACALLAAPAKKARKISDQQTNSQKWDQNGGKFFAHTAAGDANTFAASEIYVSSF
jgi:hypothetical protein